MYRKIFPLFLLIAVFVGCTQYTYYGAIESEDSNGEMRNHLVYWTKTERVLWFDECSRTVRLLTECSLETIAFNETEKDGIIFSCTSNHKGVPPNEISCPGSKMWLQIDMPEPSLFP